MYADRANIYVVDSQEYIENLDDFANLIETHMGRDAYEYFRDIVEELECARKAAKIAGCEVEELPDLMRSLERRESDDE